MNCCTESVQSQLLHHFWRCHIRLRGTPQGDREGKYPQNFCVYLVIVANFWINCKNLWKLVRVAKFWKTENCGKLWIWLFYAHWHTLVLRYSFFAAWMDGGTFFNSGGFPNCSLMAFNSSVQFVAKNYSEAHHAGDGWWADGGKEHERIPEVKGHNLFNRSVPDFQFKPLINSLIQYPTQEINTS